MEETEKQDLVFLEIRQKLQSGLLFIRDVVKDGADVKIQSDPDSLLSIQTADGTFQVNFPHGVSLVETSRQKSLGSAEHGSHFRLRLQVEQLSEAPSSVIGRLQVNVAYSFLCQSCGSVLLQDRTFGRVLPLPNGNWNALVDDWCCHPDPFANRKLLPREGDCLLGDTFILLARDSSCEQSLTREEDPSQTASAQTLPAKRGSKRVMVNCRSCAAPLAEELTADVLKLYITGVLVKPRADGVCDARLGLEGRSGSVRRRFLEQTLASRLVELSSAQSIFRFSIQTPDGKAVVLLWLLNTDSLVASFPADSFISAGDARPRKHQSCQAARAVKVLYVLCSDSRLADVVDVWEKDISVHPLPLPQSSCEELRTLLTASTFRLPAFLRCMNSYQVAYMRM